MGFFQDFTNFVGEVNSIKDGIADIASGTVQDITAAADTVRQTASEATADIATSADGVKSTLQQVAQLEPIQGIAEVSINPEDDSLVGR